MTILQKIIDQRFYDLAKYETTTFQFEPIQGKRASLYETIKNSNTLEVIAEIKRASPSKGDISLNVNPIHQAIAYENGGAACISVLTEPHFFKGSYEDLHNVAKTVAIPVLCKDFIVAPIQIDIAAAAGASVILLIVAALPQDHLQALFEYAIDQNLEVLVEVHTREELSRALDLGAQLIGVNNRDLKTFQVNLQHTVEIAQLLEGHDAVLVSESGVKTVEDAEFLASHGAKALLVGETLMRSEGAAQTLRSFKLPIQIGEVQ